MQVQVCSQEPTGVCVWAHISSLTHERYADFHHSCPASAIATSCAVGFHSQKATQKATEHFSWLAVRTITMNSNYTKKNFMKILALYKNLSDASGQ